MKIKKPNVKLVQILLAISSFSFTAIILIQHYTKDDNPSTVFQILPDENNREFIIDTPGCKIPSLNPWDPSIKAFYEYTGPYRKCEGQPSVLRVQPNAVVSLDETILEHYYEITPDKVTCYYQGIYRAGNIANFTIDDNFQLSPARLLKFNIPLKENYIRTICMLKTLQKQSRQVEYLALTPSFESHGYVSEKRTELPNILFLGIDSISRLNFIRHFTKTKDYIQKNLNPISLDGYNKVGDNTFPNLVPMLTGHYYQDFWNEFTNPSMYFDHLPFIWKEFAKIGYVTLLAEDSPDIATFNYLRRGFKMPPTDYYLRPFNLALEYTDQRYLQCLRDKKEITVIHEYLKSFLNTINHTKPYFAFVFTARLTHDVFNYAGYADDPTFQILRYLHTTNHLNNTMLFLFSDHGIRFSSVRRTYLGQFEERRPFFNIIIPPWFGKKYPKIARNMEINQKRLTTPFDIHKTLLDLLNLNNIMHKPLLETPGISLFNEVSAFRTCENATISPHWCTCLAYKNVPLDDPIVILASKAVIKTINDWTSRVRHLCSPLDLKSIHGARTAAISLGTQNSTLPAGVPDSNFLVVISAAPSDAMFEATVPCSVSSNICYDVAEISRINRFGSQSSCIKDSILQKYCFCV